MKNKKRSNFLYKIKLYAKNMPLIRDAHYFFRFIVNHRYIPRLKKPKTFNEKILFRKSNPMHPLFATCSDKIAVRDYVKNVCGTEVLIPVYYTGTSINLKRIKEIIQNNGDCVIKTNHNSGGVYFLSSHNSDDELLFIINEIHKQLKVDYGLIQNEPWYSDINPKILIEKKLLPEFGESDVRDYKFHVFNNVADRKKHIIVSVDFNRSTNHSRSFFNVDLEWLNIQLEKPSIVTHIKKPDNFDRMLEIVRELSEPFTYSRIDLYNTNGQIYFGEITFAHGNGLERFYDSSKDMWLGHLWAGDPRI